MQGAVILVLSAAVQALPAPQVPKSVPTTTPPGGARLTYGSELFFVLDDRISSVRTVAGTSVRMHLQNPLTVNGVTLAPAGTPGSLIVVTTRRSQSGDVDGAVQIHLDPLQLPGGQTLPVRAAHEYLTIERTAGLDSARATTDSFADAFIPGHFTNKSFGTGREMVLPAGTVLRAETNATIDASDPRAIVISTPPPYASEYDAPHSDLTPLPFYTPAPAGEPHPRGRPRPSASPSGSPSPGSIR